MFLPTYDGNAPISVLQSSLKSLRDQCRCKEGCRRKKSVCNQKYFFLGFKVILEIECIEFLKLPTFGVDIGIRLTGNPTIFSLPPLALLTPDTHSRKRVHRPSSLPIVHDSKLPLPSLFTLHRKIKPIRISCRIDIIMQQQTMYVLHLRHKPQIATLKSRIKL